MKAQNVSQHYGQIQSLKNADSALKNKNKKNQQNIIRISNDIAVNVEEFHLLLLEKNIN